MKNQRKRWISFLYAGSCRGELQTNMVMSYLKRDVKYAIVRRSGSRTYRQAAQRGWSIVRVRQTLSIEP